MNWLGLVSAVAVGRSVTPLVARLVRFVLMIVGLIILVSVFS